jgi:hypothetical protein
MSKAPRLLVVSLLVLVSAPAAADPGAARSCAGLIGSFNGGGLVAEIIRFSGAAWWMEHFARARPCG